MKKMKLIIEQLEDGDKSAKTITIPTLRGITQNWGKPGHGDREVVEQFFSYIYGNNLQEKIKFIEALVRCQDSCIDSYPVQRILVSLVFLDTLSSLVHEFDSSSRGNLFESLIAALLGGNVHRVGDNTKIVDVEGENTVLSLKIMNHTLSSIITGSKNSLDLQILESRKRVEYILVTVAARPGTIRFYSFSVLNEFLEPQLPAVETED